jgi:hypothetical protein
VIVLDAEPGQRCVWAASTNSCTSGSGTSKYGEIQAVSWPCRPVAVRTWAEHSGQTSRAALGRRGPGPTSSDRRGVAGRRAGRWPGRAGSGGPCRPVVGRDSRTPPARSAAQIWSSRE